MEAADHKLVLAGLGASTAVVIASAAGTLGLLSGAPVLIVGCALILGISLFLLAKVVCRRPLLRFEGGRHLLLAKPVSAPVWALGLMITAFQVWIFFDVLRSPAALEASWFRSLGSSLGALCVAPIWFSEQMFASWWRERFHLSPADDLARPMTAK